jgi:hypothetical protein
MKGPAETMNDTITLRSAIEQINKDGSGSITFAVGNVGVESQLDPLTASGVTIDGGSVGSVVISGGAGFGGLVIDGGGATIQNLVINGFGDSAITLSSSGNTVQNNYLGTDASGSSAVANGYGIYDTGGSNTIKHNVASGNTIGGIGLQGAAHDQVVGNMVGTDASGTHAVPNVKDGMYLFAGASGNTIGGTSTSARNIVSGNGYSGIGFYGQGTSNNLVEGNYIGVDSSGSKAVGNSDDGVGVGPGASGNTIGGTSTSARNILSGNGYSGIVLFGQGTSNNLVEGNYIGVDSSGSKAVGNSDDGVSVFLGASGNTIGGSAAGAGNVISGNGFGSPAQFSGLDLSGAGTSGNLVQGNDLGTDATGTKPLGNAGDGLAIFSGATGNTIGGTTSATRNIISGNDTGGLDILNSGTSGNLVEGNSIGTDVSGTVALANGTPGASGGGVGILISGGASGNTVGGTTAASRNIVSGNVSDGVQLDGAGTSGNLVEGNYVGTDVSGAVALPNGSPGAGIGGVGVAISGGASGNTVGGTTPAARNIISGNVANGIQVSGTGTSGNLVVGNFIGTDLSGANALANGIVGPASGGEGVLINGGAGFNTVGGTTAGARNIISGNVYDGVQLAGTGTNSNLVEGNFIGTDVNGTTALANGTTGATYGHAGVLINFGASFNTIGGTSTSAGNVISGTVGFGVIISDSGSSVNLVEGNLIGVDQSGLVPLPNSSGGVGIGNGLENLGYASLNTIGGTTPGAANVISANGGPGVSIAGSANLVEGNFIGTGRDGTASLGNTGAGVALFGGASLNTIGGTSSAAANVIGNNTGDGVTISGSTTSFNVVEGNFIGTNQGDATNLGNAGNGVTISAGSYSNTIGGMIAGARNVISGNALDGVDLSGNGTNFNAVEGNLIGTDVSGTNDLPNQGNGVSVENGAMYNTIGGTTSGAGNVIGGNTGDGIDITGAETSGTLVAGNSIGTSVDGSPGPGNQGNGIAIVDASNNTIGGTTDGAANFIGDNGAKSVVYAAPDPGGGAVSAPVGSAPSRPTGNGIFVGGIAKENPVQGDYIARNAVDGILIKGVSNNTIGGTSEGAGNVIVLNQGDGIHIVGASGNIVQGNDIGTDAKSDPNLGNTDDGVLIEQGSQSNTIGGSTQAAGNLISGNRANGVHISGTNTNFNVLSANLIGTDASGDNALQPNQSDGVLIDQGAQSNTVGSKDSTTLGNAISGNSGNGVVITDEGTNLNVVSSNVIGAAASNTDHGVPNQGDGVLIENGAQSNTIGSTATTPDGNPAGGNLIADNKGNGVTVGADTYDFQTIRNAVEQNLIFSNGKLGIDLGNDGVTGNETQGHIGPNQFQDYPILQLREHTSTLTYLSGILLDPSNTMLRIELFANSTADPSGHGQARIFLGLPSVSTVDNGTMEFHFSSDSIPTGYVVTATATDPSSNTSEFAEDLLIVPKTPLRPPGPPMVASADDTGTQGDGVTEVTSPILSGTTLADATVQLLDVQNDVIASTTADVNGAYTVQVPGPLAVGSYQFRVQIIDTSGDVSAPSDPLSLEIVAPPTSSVAPLPAQTTTPSFTVAWSGTDGAGGSGITSYDVFVSDNGGPFTPFQVATTATSATFAGQPGHTYGFYSAATDIFGDVQATPTAAQATTKVVSATASATFVGTDTTTQGNWKSTYGTAGFDIAQDPSAENPTIPSFASFSVGNAQSYTWSAATSDPRALNLAAAGSTTRIAACWYAAGSFSIDVHLTDGQAHRLAVYALDWDNYLGGRSERLDLVDDGTGAVLDSRTIGSFQGGVYVVWNVTGNATVRVTNLVPGANAVLSGLFLGTAAASTSTQFVGGDSSTQGNWKGTYGTDGFDLAQDPSADNPTTPPYATFSVSNAQTCTWSAATSDPRALRLAAAGSTTGIAACWYAASTFRIDVHLTDGQAHKLALYALDWDSYGGGRSEQIALVSDATGQVLDTRTLSAFQNGEYLVWNVTGSITIAVTNLNAASNAVLNGLFLGNPPVGTTAHYVGSDTSTQGNWKASYGTAGFDIAQDPSSDNPTTPPYATFSVSNAQTYAWSAATSDPRALNFAAAGSTTGIAACWYTAGSFSIDVHLTDGQAHKLAIYALDWDDYLGGRSERVDLIDDATGAVLDSQSIRSFQNGVYLVWNVTGNVTIRVTNLIPGGNAVLSGLFLGTTPA